MDGERIAPSQDTALKPNPDTWLDFTDLVFIDPVGTGFSRLVDPDDALRDRYLSVDGDTDADRRLHPEVADRERPHHRAQVLRRRELRRLPRPPRRRGARDRPRRRARRARPRLAGPRLRLVAAARLFAAADGDAAAVARRDAHGARRRLRPGRARRGRGLCQRPLPRRPPRRRERRRRRRAPHRPRHRADRPRPRHRRRRPKAASTPATSPARPAAARASASASTTDGVGARRRPARPRPRPRRDDRAR